MASPFRLLPQAAGGEWALVSRPLLGTPRVQADWAESLLYTLQFVAPVFMLSNQGAISGFRVWTVYRWPWLSSTARLPAASLLETWTSSGFSRSNPPTYFSPV